MKKLITLLFTSVFTLYISYSQSNILNFNNETGKFDSSQGKPPFGEKIIVNGESKGAFKEISLKIIYGTNEQEVTANINGNRWSAIVGPFPINANVLFIIKEKRTISEDEIDEIRGHLEEAIEEAYNSFFNIGKSKSPSDFADEMINILDRSIGYKWKEYSTESGLSLKEFILVEIHKLIINENWHLIFNNFRNITNIRDNQFYKKIIENRESNEWIKRNFSTTDTISTINNFSNVYRDSLFLVVDTLLAVPGTNTAERLWDSSLKNEIALYTSAKSEINKLLKSIELIKQEIIITTMPTSQEIMGIQSYLSIDMGMTYIADLDKTPFFVTISPHFTKIEPAENYRFGKDNWKYFISPTLGFGVSGDGIGEIKPIYFVGLGVRLNKVVRMATGVTYHKPVEKDHYKWNFAFNASISVNYVSEFLKLITSAQSNIHN